MKSKISMNSIDGHKRRVLGQVMSSKMLPSAFLNWTFLVLSVILSMAKNLDSSTSVGMTLVIPLFVLSYRFLLLTSYFLDFRYYLILPFLPITSYFLDFTSYFLLLTS